MPAQKLSSEQIQDHLQKLPGWVVDDVTLRKTYKFPSFAKSMEFVNQLAQMAESVQHHPDIDIRYDRVSLGLSTHDSGGITAADIEMVASADDLAGSAGG
ncbi:MAG TPA: 4a-hydroxytetrahydrobiopterin dehydratase [Capsulimonadaceae bacterium]|nr:4a-hydroxytetrahydrobiopterin dehydratase [Capsulimonadaceae bacterium]